MRHAWFALAVYLVPLSLKAADPQWWTDEDTRIIDPNATPSNYSPVNLGQLKFVAVQAATHLDLVLPQYGGAGMHLGGLVAKLKSDPSSNYAPANLGQLKAISKAFYDRLRQVGYDTKWSLVSHGYPSNWLHVYPWNPATPKADNYAPANIGQLKMVFSFDGSKDSDSDGLPDWWERAFGFSENDPNDAEGDADGDGVTNRSEYVSGRNPHRRDNPLLQISVSAFTTP